MSTTMTILRTCGSNALSMTRPHQPFTSTCQIRSPKKWPLVSVKLLLTAILALLLSILNAAHAAPTQNPATSSTPQLTADSGSVGPQGPMLCPYSKDTGPAHTPVSWEQEKDDVQRWCSQKFSRYDTSCCVENFKQARGHAPCADVYSIEYTVATNIQHKQCGQRVQLGNNILRYTTIVARAAARTICGSDDSKARQIRVNYVNFLKAYASGSVVAAQAVYDEKYAHWVSTMPKSGACRDRSDAYLIKSEEDLIIQESGKPPGLAPSAISAQGSPSREQSPTGPEQNAMLSSSNQTTNARSDPGAGQQMNMLIKLYVHHVSVVVAVVEKCEKSVEKSRQIQANFKRFVAVYAPDQAGMANDLYDQRYHEALRRYPASCPTLQLDQNGKTLWSITHDEQEIIKLSGKSPALVPGVLQALSSTSQVQPSTSPASAAPARQLAAANPTFRGDPPMNWMLSGWLKRLRSEVVSKAGGMEACKRGNRQQVRADIERFFQTHAPAYGGQVFDKFFDHDVSATAMTWNRGTSCGDIGFSLALKNLDSVIGVIEERILKALPPGAEPAPARSAP